MGKAGQDETPDYQELQEHTRRFYEAAKAKLAQIERERSALIEKIQAMELLLGIRRVPTQKRRGRIPSATLEADIRDILAKSEERKLGASEILEELVENRSYPGTRSLRTRVYGALSKWAREGEFLKRVERGVYQLTD